MKRGAVAVGLVAAALILSACGSGGSSSTATSSSAAAPESSTKHASAAAVEAERGGSAGNGSTTAEGSTPEPEGSGETDSGSQGSPGPPSRGAGAFRIPGGDNSVPEYGSEATSSEKGEARAALSAYLKARQAGDWQTACDLLAGEARANLEQIAHSADGKYGGCAAILKAFSEQPSGNSSLSNPLAGHDLAMLRVKGDNAFALFYGPGRQEYMMPMAREGSAWKVTQFAALPYPPESTSGG